MAHNTAAVTTSRHLRDGQPILFVSHDSDGEWQFLCGDIGDDEECMVICLACAYLRDKTIGELADMPAGWQARRDSVAAPWECFAVGKAPERGES
jgi:hypothetical protein